MNKLTSKNKRNVSYNMIIMIIVLTVLFIESVFTLLLGFKRGIRRREILTYKNDIGFDIDIIMRYPS